MFFLIPIFIGIATVAGGAATVGGCCRIGAAKDRYARRRNDYDCFIGGFSARRDRLNRSLAGLGEMRLAALPSLRCVVDFLRKARLKNRDLNDPCEIPLETLSRWEASAIKAEEVAGGLGSAAATGALTAIGAYGAVGALASASTGTAIASLSGAAASNATLAWLGGGALAAGGGGVALGTVVLGGLVAAPALAVSAFMIHAKASEIETEVAAAIAALDADEAHKRTLIVKMDACHRRIDELAEATLRLRDALLSLLASANPESDDDAWQVARAAKALADTLEAKTLD